jgi:hypothetical protein
MPLGRGFVELFEAIPDRIEVSGHRPTWRITGGSFEAALAYARQAFGETVVVAREDRSRLWPRVTLTVTSDPALAADAPPIETFADREVEVDVGEILAPEHDVEEEPGPPVSALEEIFAHQEQLRQERRRIPAQRTRRG